MEVNLTISMEVEVTSKEVVICFHGRGTETPSSVYGRSLVIRKKRMDTGPYMPERRSNVNINSSNNNEHAS